MQAEQAQKKLPHLAAPAFTRWGSLISCFSTLLKSEELLQNLVSSRSFITVGGDTQVDVRTQIRTYVTDPNFVANLKRSHIILEPIDRYIKAFQSDATPISDVYDAFVQLPTLFQKMDLPKAQREFLVQATNERFDFIYGDAHGVAYMLDPRYLAQGLDTKFKRNIENFILDFPSLSGTNNEIQRESICRQLTLFTIDATAEQKNDTFQYRMLVKGKKTPLEYWMTDGSNWPDLQRIATRVFQVVPSSASCERVFSSMGFVHSKPRNRLQAKSVEKQVYIRTNWNCNKR